MVRSMCVAVNVCVKSHLRLFDSFKVQLCEIVKQCASLDDVCILITGHQIMSGATKLRNKVSPNTRGSAFVDGNSSFQQSSKVHTKKDLRGGSGQVCQARNWSFPIWELRVCRIIFSCWLHLCTNVIWLDLRKYWDLPSPTLAERGSCVFMCNQRV